MPKYSENINKLRAGTVIPANPLALNAQRKLDERRQRALTRYYLNAGAGGLAVGVHTTQFAIRNAEIGLFEPVLRIAAEEAAAFYKKTGQNAVMIAGACGPTPQAVKETETAAKLGYDAVLLSPGGLNDYTEADILARTKEVAAVLPVIGFYLQPSVGGRLFSFDYWRRLCEIEGVVAIKSAPFNRYQTIDVVRAAAMSDRSAEITLYTGNDDNIAVDLLTTYRFSENGKTYEKSFAGGLLGHWAVWTNTAVKLFAKLKATAAEKEIPRELLTLAAQITDCNAAFFDTANNFAGCIAGIHEVLRRQGILEGIWCLNPAETLSPGQAQEIDRVYNAYPALNDDAFVAGHLQEWLQ